MNYEEAKTCIKANICYKQEVCADSICKSTEKRLCAIDVAIEALEKQIPNTPLIINRNGRTIPFCPICGGLLIKCADEDYREILEILDDDWRYMNYCDSCGQRIDWSEVE